MCWAATSPSSDRLGSKECACSALSKTHPCAELVFLHSRPHIPICYPLFSLPRALRSQIPRPPNTWHSLPHLAAPLLLSDPLTFVASTGNHRCLPVTLGWALLTEWVENFCSQRLLAATITQQHANSGLLRPAMEAQSARRCKSFPSAG